MALRGREGLGYPEALDNPFNHYLDLVESFIYFKLDVTLFRVWLTCDKSVRERGLD